MIRTRKRNEEITICSLYTLALYTPIYNAQLLSLEASKIDLFFTCLSKRCNKGPKKLFDAPNILK